MGVRLWREDAKKCAIPNLQCGVVWGKMNAVLQIAPVTGSAKRADGRNSMERQEPGEQGPGEQGPGNRKSKGCGSFPLGMTTRKAKALQARTLQEG